MKRSSVLLALGALSLGLSLSVAAPKPEGAEVLVASDAIVAPEGFRPAPGKPVYYIFSQVSISLGESIAGIKLPDPSSVEQTVAAELAKQGFVRTQVGGPMPSVLILATYGAANFKASPDIDDLDMYRDFVLPGSIIHIPEEAMKVGTIMREDGVIVENTQRYRATEALAQFYKYLSSPRYLDQAKVETIVGTKKMFAASNTMFTSNGLKVAAASNEDRFYITIAAFDAQLFAKKQKVLLWRTSMSLAWRYDFTATLPTLLASGGPFFGTDVKTPLFLDDRERRNFEVKIGESTSIPESSKPGSNTRRTN